jgi:hypothetical protein
MYMAIVAFEKMAVLSFQKELLARRRFAFPLSEEKSKLVQSVTREKGRRGPWRLSKLYSQSKDRDKDFSPQAHPLHFRFQPRIGAISVHRIWECPFFPACQGKARAMGYYIK